MTRKQAWYEDEDLWRIFGDCMFTEEQFQSAAEEIQQLIELIGEKPQNVLDLACGAGRHSLALADMDINVCGVDLSRHLLSEAKRRAQHHDIEWVQADMRQFGREGAFDWVLCMWTSFGYFDDPHDDIEVLHRCYENLRSGGHLVIDVTGKEYVLRNIQPVHLTEYEDGKLLIERPTLSEGMTRYDNEWLLIDGDQVHRTHWFHNLYSGDRLMNLFYQAGFRQVHIYGSVAGDEYDLDASRLLVIGEK